MTDDGARPPAGRAGGQGLSGMRERAAVYGGELEAGPAPGGGWRVRTAARERGVIIGPARRRPAAAAHRLSHDPRRAARHRGRGRGRRRRAGGAADRRAAPRRRADGRAHARHRRRSRRRAGSSPSGSAARVLILTTFDLDEYAFSGLRAGASGFLLKDVPPEELLAGDPRGRGRGRGRGAERHPPAAGRLRPPVPRRPRARDPRRAPGRR